MPSITPGKRSNPIDRNAVSADRTRRNWQRLAEGGVNDLIQVSPGGGIVETATGLAVEVDPAGALTVGPDGLAVKVDGVTVMIVGDQLVAAPAGPSPAQVMARISLGV